ncbi:MAG TPA: acetyl-CoA carboxylase carboxyltransferase subunit alpha [Paracoccaceae bacterium]|nr:acetyl-CoA carboxylase carboxyltransferase subunit alpha [Paracoccaceae bacterium]
MQNFLDFEKGPAELQGKASELRAMAGTNPDLDVSAEAEQLEHRAAELLKSLYAKLDPWQKCQVARHPDRPHARHYIERLFSDYTPLAGDRLFGEDLAIIGGLARFRGQPVMVLGHEKGEDTKTRLKHNFGMARPEGYRKVVRLMQMADRFGLPIITLIDTQGAYPGKGAEERGQAEAIARATDTCLSVGVPLVAVVLGEGGSGGAVAMATGNRLVMLEHAVYSVISPEGCAAILWKNAEKAEEAANALRLTAQDLEKLGLTDLVVPEPVGGAQRNPHEAIDRVGEAVDEMLEELGGLSPESLRSERRQRFIEIGTKGLG